MWPCLKFLGSLKDGTCKTEGLFERQRVLKILPALGKALGVFLRFLESTEITDKVQYSDGAVVKVSYPSEVGSPPQYCTAVIQYCTVQY
jgi:hypothetical protein